MASKARRKAQMWCAQPLTPLMEGPDPDMQEEGSKKESSWEAIREWFRNQKNHSGSAGFSSPSYVTPKIPDLRLLLGVLGCPLAPIPLLSPPDLHQSAINDLRIKDAPLENSIAHYIIQQYLAATGCLKQQKMAKNVYASGTVKMMCCETEVSSGKNVKSIGTRSGEINGCFVLWQMVPDMWSLELVVGGNKVVAGSDGKTVWRHTPWLGTHPAKGPQRPLRRIIQLVAKHSGVIDEDESTIPRNGKIIASKADNDGEIGLDPKRTASLFAKAQCLGEKRIGEDDCFVLKVSADRAAVMERNEGPAEVMRHVLYGYFCQKSGLLIYLEDSHLTRVQSVDSDEAVYWETTIGSSIGEYEDVDGLLIAHHGRSIATVFRFGETSMQHSRTRMEEIWTVDDVVFNVPGLSGDYFTAPADIFDNLHSP